MCVIGERKHTERTVGCKLPTGPTGGAHKYLLLLIVRRDIYIFTGHARSAADFRNSVILASSY